MNKLLLLVCLLFHQVTFGKDKVTQKKEAIIAEGKLLYRSEKASWHGTDLFLEQYTNRENIGGYFSYVNNGTPTCIFYSKASEPKVIGTISFDSSYNLATATTDLSERAFTHTEQDLYLIRKAAVEQLGKDTMFLTYKNTSLNLIPLIADGKKKVYILTGPKEAGVAIFGNDYLLTFDEHNKLSSQKRLHKNIISVPYGKNEESGVAPTVTMHNHLPETGDFITATDICTLMLYRDFTGWETHNVVSKEYLNIWNCKTNDLVIIPMKTIKKINEYQESKDKEKQDRQNGK